MSPALPAGPVVEAEEATAEPVGTATVTARIDPEGKATEFHVDYGLETTAEVATESVALAVSGFEPETVKVKLEGLQPGRTYHFHFVAANAAAPQGNAGADETFASLPAAAIESESVSQVSSASARLRATINPLTLPSTYRFEYGPTTGYGTSVPVPEGYAGSGVVGSSFSVLVTGLTPGTVYHFRVVAHNEFGESQGADQSFTMQSGEGTSLIDGRAWELVSPADKHGAALEALTAAGGDIQAAADGSAIAYIAKAPVDAEPRGNRSFASQELLATRRQAGVWSTQDIATPHEGVAGLGEKGNTEYKLFSPDLSRTAVEPEGTTPLSPQAGERTPYVRIEAACAANTSEPIPDGCFTPLVDPLDVPAGTEFGLQESNGIWLPGTGVEFDTATSDVEHVIVNAPQALSQGFETGGAQALYEWPGKEAESSGGELEPVSIVEGGESAAVEGGATVGDDGVNMRNAVSADGDRIFFETALGHHLFMRDVAKQASVQLDRPEAGVAVPFGGAAVYQEANNEGSRVFFTDQERLTNDAGVEATANGQAVPDLYECEIVEGAGGKLECKLSDLTPLGFEGEAAAVQGFVLGASEDGQYVYFVANGILTNGGAPVPNAVRGSCLTPSGTMPPAAASCNLYVWHDGVTRLVAVLSARDFPDWAPEGGLTRLTARVSPDGSYLAFMSQRSLTGYDNHDAISGEPDEEVYEYDALDQRLVCASCDPSGAQPVGVLDPNSEQPSLLIDRPFSWFEQRLAASIPGWTAIALSHALYQSRYLSNEGRLFFDSLNGLVSGDANGKEDVYEFEPEGVGGCTTSLSSSSATFVGEVAGRLVRRLCGSHLLGYVGRRIDVPGRQRQGTRRRGRRRRLLPDLRKTVAGRSRHRTRSLRRPRLHDRRAVSVGRRDGCARLQQCRILPRGAGAPPGVPRRPAQRYVQRPGQRDARSRPCGQAQAADASAEARGGAQGLQERRVAQAAQGLRSPGAQEVRPEPQEETQRQAEAPQVRRVVATIALFSALVLGAGVSAADAATPWWHLTSRVRPAILPRGGEGFVDFRALNMGDATANGAGCTEVPFGDGQFTDSECTEPAEAGKGAFEKTPVILTATLPEGVTVQQEPGEPGEPERPKVSVITFPESEEKVSSKCSEPKPREIQCHYEFALVPYTYFEISVAVKVAPDAVSGAVANAEVAGAGGASVRDQRALKVGEPGESVPFGVEDDSFSVVPEEEGGAVQTQAGSHPFQMTSNLALNQTDSTLEPPALPKQLKFTLPPGLVGNAVAFPRCNELDFLTKGLGGFEDLCPENTAIGVVVVTVHQAVFGAERPYQSYPIPVFNLTPKKGEPVRFGFFFIGIPVTIDFSVRTGGDYGATATVSNITQIADFLSQSLTIWGVPGEAVHDPSRGWGCIGGEFYSRIVGGRIPCTPADQTSPPPFLTLPTNCQEPWTAGVTGESWPLKPTPGAELPSVSLAPVSYSLHDEFGRAIGLTGCNRALLQSVHRSRPGRAGCKHLHRCERARARAPGSIGKFVRAGELVRQGHHRRAARRAGRQPLGGQRPGSLFGELDRFRRLQGIRNRAGREQSGVYAAIARQRRRDRSRRRSTTAPGRELLLDRGQGGDRQDHVAAARKPGGRRRVSGHPERKSIRQPDRDVHRRRRPAVGRARQAAR